MGLSHDCFCASVSALIDFVGSCKLHPFTLFGRFIALGACYVIAVDAELVMVQLLTDQRDARSLEYSTVQQRGDSRSQWASQDKAITETHAGRRPTVPQRPR